MTIPHDNIIKQELLMLLGTESKKRIHTSEAYEVLGDSHPELTFQERNEKYQNSVSKWANRVQFARLHLVTESLLFSANEGPNPSPGYWILTPEGEYQANKLISRSGDGALEEQIKEDLKAQELENGTEGEKLARLISYFERNPVLRKKAIIFHGTKCKVCNFDFEEKYGEHGKNYIEVHHIVPLSTIPAPSTIDPEKDLTVLCSNCHRMIHRRREKTMTPEQLVTVIAANEKA
jgi:predicted HNH restriction endonuclease